ncbi:hypothetical protein [Palpita vitrealis nucleopolyhedrovirus]|uniref:Uncharacterized protein n=1 Tax=Palpita vitrealis nucleopolyhedrovirus TaxID=2951960 RepID=A0AAE9LNL5_9ABAC|nr:hypothetical protein [Palpita vitrealis nucleopolyhedrovirus]
MFSYFCTNEMLETNVIMRALIPCLIMFFVVEMLCKNSVVVNFVKIIANKYNVHQRLLLFVNKYQSINYAVKIAAIYYCIYSLYYFIVFLHCLLFFNIHSKIIFKMCITSGLSVMLCSLFIK